MASNQLHCIHFQYTKTFMPFPYGGKSYVAIIWCLLFFGILNFLFANNKFFKRTPHFLTRLLSEKSPPILHKSATHLTESRQVRYWILKTIKVSNVSCLWDMMGTEADIYREKCTRKQSSETVSNQETKSGRK